MKTGIYTIMKALLKACEVYQRFGGVFSAAVAASPLTDAEKAEVLSVISAVNSACNILRKLYNSPSA